MNSYDIDLVQPRDMEASAPASDRTGQLSPQIRDHLGQELRALYSAFLSSPQPMWLLELLARLDTALTARQRTEAETFRHGLTMTLPVLRGFAVSLTGNATRADDLVQETLLKAWANQHRFVPGTNLGAWLMTIARNTFYSESRRRKREVEDADGIAAGRLIEMPAQKHNIELKKVWQAITMLPAVQREALMMVGAQGMSYEAAAAALGCQIGTVKSRVSRARSCLAGTFAQDYSAG